MKTLLSFAALALVACLSLQSCPTVGATIDPIALFGPAQLAWPEVSVDLEAGYAHGESTGELEPPAAAALRLYSTELGQALEDRDRDALRMVPWPTMYPWASRGIDAQLAAGEIGPGVAESFRVHDEQFDEVIQRLRGTTE